MAYKTKLLKQLSVMAWCFTVFIITIYFFLLVPDSFNGWKDYLTYQAFFFLLFITAERRILPWITNRLHMGWWVCVYPFILQFLLVFTLIFLLSWIVGGIHWKDWQWNVSNLWHLALPLLLPNSLAILLFISRKGLQNWTKSEGYHLQLLNQELNPHMLNANLTILHPLILMNTAIAVRFVKLNIRMFHYYLTHRNVLSIPISEELEQVNIRVQMQEISKQKSVFLSMYVDHSVLKRRIPTMLLVNLMENCFSYGLCFDSERPISIHIEPVDNGKISIRICNYLKAATVNTVIGTGTSLSRTAALLRLLDPLSTMRIERNEKQFVVSILYFISI